MQDARRLVPESDEIRARVASESQDAPMILDSQIQRRTVAEALFLAADHAISIKATLWTGLDTVLSVDARHV